MWLGWLPGGQARHRGTALQPHRVCASERRAGSLEAGLMSQSAVVRDYRALETGRRRANRLVLTVAG
jgi:hypothetical protein